MNKTKVILSFSILFLLIAMPACFAMDNDTAVIGDNQAVTDYYFDANVENDTGDGSLANPYKSLTSDRIMDDSNIHLADGEYELDFMAYVGNVNIIGSNPEKTIVSYKNGIGFSLDGPLTLKNVTLVGFAINAYDENLTAVNSIFKDYSSPEFSPIMSDNGRISIDNCTFRNNSAFKGGAVYLKNGNLIVKDSLFINNSANQFGGAIAFENYTHAKIYNTEVNNCYAPFGGAITSLKSDVNLVNFISRNNRAKYYGGSVYSIYHNLTMSNSLLINNSANVGGALFVDGVETFLPRNSRFIDNTADIASAVYSRLSDCYYDSISDPKLNNSFKNNKVIETNALNITFEDDTYLLIRFNESYSEILPSYYNLRDLGQVSSVKNQGKGGNCWAFSAMAALESAILKATNVTYDFSEENMKNLMSMYSDYGWAMETNVGGYDKMAVGYLTSWLGPVSESDDGYNDNSVLSPLMTSLVHVQNIAFLTRDNYTDNDAIKKAIMSYGAVSTSIYWSSSNLKGKNYYFSGSSKANHAVAIVGWDDNYDKSNFKNAPEANGAWIVKNSWGNKTGDKGFYYVSYYDSKIAQPGKYVSYAIVLNNTLKYDKIYQYDVQGRTDSFFNTTDTVWYKTKFKATADEYLAAVSTYFEKDTVWDLSVYVNNALKLTQSGKASPSYSTIDLSKLIALKKGDIFEIVFKIVVDGDAGVPISESVSLNQETYAEGNSFISYDGKTWKDLYELAWTYPDHTYNSQVASIKAFTLFDKIHTEVDIKVIYNKLNDVSTIVAYVTDEWGNKVKSGNVIFNVDGKSFQKDVSEGKASLNYNLNNDLHNIVAKYSGADYYQSKDTIQFSKQPSNLTVSFEIADIEYGQDLMAYTVIRDSFANIIMDDVNLKINNNIYRFTVGEDMYYRIPFKLDVGTYNAEISGNNFKSKKVSFNVVKSSANLNLNIDVRYDRVSIAISLSKPINDTAVINVFGKNVTVNIVNGNANLEYGDLACGSYPVSVYLSDNYKNKFKKDGFTINYVNTSLAVPNMTTYFYSGGELKITLKDANGKYLSNKQISVTVNNFTTDCKTDNKGIAKFEAYLENGVWDVNVEFAGDSYYAPSSSSAKIEVLTTVIPISKLTKTYGSHYTFKLLDTFGNPLTEFITEVEVDGISQYIESDSKGIFSLEIDENPGNHELVIINTVNDETVSQTLKVISRITDNKAVTMYYGAAKYYNVKVLDDDGNAAKGVKVTFNFNGKTYTRTTNANGYASLKLSSFSPKTYTITASYKGFNVSNKIIIKPTLVMSAKTVKKSKTFKYTVKLLSSKGKILKNKKITVKFKGKTYKAKTNSKGIASFNVKALSKTGKFKLTASYNAAKISKTITIKK